MIPVRVLGTASSSLGRRVETAEVARRAGFDDAAELEKKTGIVARSWIEPETSAPDAAARVLKAALDVSGINAKDLRKILFVASPGADNLIPATAHAVAGAIGASRKCDCVDVNNACMGFLSAFDLAARAIATGTGPIGIVVLEILSRYIDPSDVRPYAVLGDGAAAVILAPSDGSHGMRASHLGSDPSAPHAIRLAHPGLTQRRETIRFSESNARISAGAIDLIREAVQAVLEDSAAKLADIEWVLPHQPNGRLLENIIQGLQLDRDRVVPIAAEVGSIGAASIPMSLDRLIAGDRVRPHQKILMAGVGAGVSYGAILYQVGNEAPRSGSRSFVA